MAAIAFSYSRLSGIKASILMYSIQMIFMLIVGIGFIIFGIKNSGEVNYLIKGLGGFDGVIKTITADNGSEFLDSERIKKAGKCSHVFYAHPYCSWERGSNDNSNRMLRRFIPKGTDIGTISENRLQEIEDWVNNYPRRILNYRTASEAYSA